MFIATLYSLQNGNSPLTHACVENDMELVKLFCDYHANMNHQGKVANARVRSNVPSSSN